jgi:hypothetical protein
LLLVAADVSFAVITLGRVVVFTIIAYKKALAFGHVVGCLPLLRNRGAKRGRRPLSALGAVEPLALLRGRQSGDLFVVLEGQVFPLAGKIDLPSQPGGVGK